MLSLLPAVLSSALATYAGQFGSRRLYLWTKPLPLLLLALVIALHPAVPAKQLLLMALMLAWLGDIALLFPARLFLLGLLAFLAAHLAMMAALLQLGAQFLRLPTIVAIVAAVIYARLLWPRQKILRAAVLFYSVVLALVVALAVPFAWNTPSWWSLLPAALLFAFSDSALGWNKFRQPLPYSQAWILSSYFAAQLLFAYSFLTVAS